MIRKKLGGLSQLDLVTTAGVTLSDDWDGGGMITIPVTKAATVMINPTRMTTATIFLRDNNDIVLLLTIDVKFL